MIFSPYNFKRLTIQKWKDTQERRNIESVVWDFRKSQLGHPEIADTLAHFRSAFFSSQIAIRALASVLLSLVRAGLFSLLLLMELCSFYRHLWSEPIVAGTR